LENKYLNTAVIARNVFEDGDVVVIIMMYIEADFRLPSCAAFSLLGKTSSLPIGKRSRKLGCHLGFCLVELVGCKALEDDRRICEQTEVLYSEASGKLGGCHEHVEGVNRGTEN
jgi:hypothetical protein